MVGLAYDVGTIPHPFSSTLLIRDQSHQTQIGQQRSATFEISNLGAIEKQPGIEIGSDGSWSIERLIFGQSAMVTGPVMTISIASINQGPLTMTFSWQSEAIDAATAKEVIRDAENLLRLVIRDK